MPSISGIVTHGYGSWGSINDVVTRGYGMGDELNVYALPLHAHPTSMLLHAEATVGEKNTLFIISELTDETGEVLVDQAGEILVAYGETPVLVLHALPTNTLIHAEDLS